MRQVPHYAIIGNGRSARHFCHYLSLLKIPYKQWTRSDSQSLKAVVDSYSVVFLLINDSAVEPFIQTHTCLSDKQCVHFSGSLVTDLALGAHPLMTFGPSLYSLEAYQEIPWVLDAPEVVFESIFPGLPNPSFSIEKNNRGLYHALCVLSNNFTTLLWRKCFERMLAEFNIPKAHVMPIFKQTMNNISVDYQSALTGPLVRDDQCTIEKNLKALEGDAFQRVYQAFVTAYYEEYK